MPNHEQFSEGNETIGDGSFGNYEYPSFEQHMQEMEARESEGTYAETRSLDDTEKNNNEVEDSDEQNLESESMLANNLWSPYQSYEADLRNNNEKFGKEFARLNESVYADYDKAANEAMQSSIEYSQSEHFLNGYGVDKINQQRHYYLYEGDGKMREVITPLKIDVNLDGKVVNRNEFEPESLEIFENMRAKDTEAYIKSRADERKEMAALIQLNILNGGFANHGSENLTIATRNELPDYQNFIADKLAIEGDEAVIPPNPNGEMELPEYLDNVADIFNDMADEAEKSYQEFVTKRDKAFEDSHNSRNPIRRLWAGRRFAKLRAQQNSRLKELRTINLYRSAANDLLERLDNQE